MPDRDRSAYRAVARGGLIGLALAILLAGFYASTVLAVIRDHECEKQRTEPEHYAHSVHKPPPTPTACRQPLAVYAETMAAEEAEKDWKYQQTLWKSAWATLAGNIGGLFVGFKWTDGGILLFTGLLWWVTRGLWTSTRGLESEARDQHETLRQPVEVARQSGEAAKVAAQAAMRSAELASAQFIATHRPRLTVRAVFLLETGLPDVGDRLIILVYNKGDTSVTMVEVSFYFQISGPGDVYLPQVAVVDPTLPEAIPSGHQRQMEASINSTWREWKEIADAAIAQDVGNATRWYVELRVSIAYLDESGRRRQTSIDRTYDIRQRSFSRIEGSDFEYED
jgi:hypothetical protein